MSTINDLSVVSSIGSDDKLPIWSNANGVTRGLPISVLDGRYLSQADISLLAISPNVETFSAGVDFTPGVSLSLTLANQYMSAANVEIFFDGGYQGPDQYTLAGLGLVFSSPIPVGVEKVYVRGGVARLIGAPSDGTVTTPKIVDGAVTTSKLADGSVTDPKVALGSKLYNRVFTPINIDDYGAVGDGVHDDAPAIRLAIAAAVARGGGTVEASAKRYGVGSNVPVPPSITLAGAGQKATEFVALTANFNMFELANPTLGNVNICYHDFAINANGFTGVNGLMFTLGAFIAIYNITFKGTVYNISMDRCRFADIYSIEAWGLGTLPLGECRFYSSVDVDVVNAPYSFYIHLRGYNGWNTGSGTQNRGIYVRRGVAILLEEININDMTVGNVGFAGTGLLLENDCQGVKVSNSGWGGPGVGVLLQTGSGVNIPPNYCTITDIDVDMATICNIGIFAGLHITVTAGFLTSSGVGVAATATALIIGNSLDAGGTADIIINGVQIDRLSSVAGQAIQLDTVNRVTITNCHVTNCIVGIALFNTVTNLRVLDNQFFNITHPLQSGGAGAAQAGNFFRNNTGIPAASFTSTPTLPASGVFFVNNTGWEQRVYIVGGTVAGVSISGAPTGVGSPSSHLLSPGDSIAVTYSVAPAWNWIPVN